MRYLLIVLSCLLLPLGTARADVHVGVGIAVPGVSISISNYPRLVRIPGYPVYYDPYLSMNLFFYDGLYWVFADDDWYVSDWYNGPWTLVARVSVPVYILRIPVRYYRHPPPYFHDWHRDQPPRWNERWGHQWQERRSGWNKPAQHAVPPRAPLPSYQQHFSGQRYPQNREMQETIRREHYRYQPRDPVAREQYQKKQSRPGPKDDDRKRGR